MGAGRPRAGTVRHQFMIDEWLLGELKKIHKLENPQITFNKWLASELELIRQEKAPIIEEKLQNLVKRALEGEERD